MDKGNEQPRAKRRRSDEVRPREQAPQMRSCCPTTVTQGSHAHGCPNESEQSRQNRAAWAQAEEPAPPAAEAPLPKAVAGPAPGTVLTPEVLPPEQSAPPQPMAADPPAAEGPQINVRAKGNSNFRLNIDIT